MLIIKNYFYIWEYDTVQYFFIFHYVLQIEFFFLCRFQLPAEIDRSCLFSF